MVHTATHAVTITATLYDTRCMMIARMLAEIALIIPKRSFYTKCARWRRVLYAVCVHVSLQ